MAVIDRTNKTHWKRLTERTPLINGLADHVNDATQGGTPNRNLKLGDQRTRQMMQDLNGGRVLLDQVWNYSENCGMITAKYTTIFIFSGNIPTQNAQ